jgi:hypothetical protein
LQRLAVDPNLNSIIYFGARSGNGLWKSTDYGVTWSNVTAFKWTGELPCPLESISADISKGPISKPQVTPIPTILWESLGLLLIRPLARREVQLLESLLVSEKYEILP